jgi:hypothetical protein
VAEDESAMAGDAIEQWLPVPDWDFYEVSDKRRVRIAERTVAGRWGPHRATARIVKPFPGRGGSPTVTLQRPGKNTTRVVSVLVQQVFGLPPEVAPVPDAGEPERWLPVPGHQLYHVSDLGRVRSFHGGKGCGKRGGLLSPAPRSGPIDYLCVALYEDGKRSYRLVHQLVMEAFVGQRPAGQEVRHGPGGHHDNRLVNLSYGTRAENAEDKRRDGTLIFGEGIAGSCLTEQVVIECRGRYAAGETTTALAAEFSVNAGTMSEAVTGGTWAHLPGATPRGAKAYYKKGVENALTKLTPEIAAELRERYAAGERQYALAAEFGVSQSTVWRLIHGKTALGSGH